MTDEKKVKKKTLADKQPNIIHSNEIISIHKKKFIKNKNLNSKNYLALG